MGNIDWGRTLVKSANSFAPGQLEDLRDDVYNQMIMQGKEDAARVVPKERLRQKIREIAKPDMRQYLSAGVGATGGGLLGAGAGALMVGLARGKKHAPLGLLGAIPGAIYGYGLGEGREKKKQLMEALKGEYGQNKESAVRWEGGVKGKNPYGKVFEPVSPGAKGKDAFMEFIRSAKDRAPGVKYPRVALKDDIRELKRTMGRDFYTSEKRLIRKHVLDLKGKAIEGPLRKLRPYRPPEPEYRPKDTFKSSPQPKPKAPKNQRPRGASSGGGGGGGGASSAAAKHKKVKLPVKFSKTPLAIMGGLAALSGLGLAAAHYWPKDKDSKLRS
jgi:hypothetical protein